MPTLKGAKPCPFCGNDVINIDVIDGEATPWCTNCSAQGPSKYFGPDGTAAGAWNDTRWVESDDLDAMRARAEAAEARAAQVEADARLMLGDYFGADRSSIVRFGLGGDLLSIDDLRRLDELRDATFYTSEADTVAAMLRILATAGAT